jgi:hypothetical protein
MKITAPAILFAAIALSGCRTNTALQATADSLKTWTADEVLLAAVRAQNASAVSLAEIQQQDKTWINGTAGELVTRVTTGACADRLRSLASAGGYGEAFVMDNQGALVCATQKTSDYWQGDEPKFTRASGGTTFIGDRAFDTSSNALGTQVSLPIMENGRTIGVLMVTIR